LTAPARIADRESDGPDNGPTRRCFVNGAVRPTAELLRFVVDPEGRIVPDVAHRLPGRGLWLTARRDIVSQAVAKRLFARAAKAPVTVEAGLEDRIEALLARRCAELLGLARRAGLVEAGFVKVRAALLKREAAVLIAAIDGAEDGRAKLGALASGLAVVSCLSAEELGAALGREQVVHAALRPGRLADLFLAEARRLQGFRAGAKVDVSER
jgi:predicted RNA-binding protein YlxR (DUF448 family)